MPETALLSMDPLPSGQHGAANLDAMCRAGQISLLASAAGGPVFSLFSRPQGAADGLICGDFHKISADNGIVCCV